MTTPASLSRAISSCFGASANEATAHPLGDDQLDPLGRVGASERRLTPNGASVRSLTSWMTRRSSVVLIVPRR